MKYIIKKLREIFLNLCKTIFNMQCILCVDQFMLYQLINIDNVVQKTSIIRKIIFIHDINLSCLCLF
jgi:hypothetical protein